MQKVYICSPCRGDYGKNLANARQYSRWVVELGYIPITPHIYLTQFLDDTVDSERETGLRIGLELLRECSEVWVFGNPSEGMKAEIDFAESIGIPVINGIIRCPGKIPTLI